MSSLRISQTIRMEMLNYVITICCKSRKELLMNRGKKKAFNKN